MPALQNHTRIPPPCILNAALLPYHSRVPELTLKPLLKSQNSRPCKHSQNCWLASIFGFCRRAKVTYLVLPPTTPEQLLSPYKMTISGAQKHKAFSLDRMIWKKVLGHLVHQVCIGLQGIHAKCSASCCMLFIMLPALEAQGIGL